MNIKHFTDTDVLTAAKDRIKEVINTFDKCHVMFSGGKDSLVLLHLTQEVYDEMGIKEKVNVIFRDEEIIPQIVIDFVIKHWKSGKYNFRYYATQLKSEKFIMGKKVAYIQWDENRKWIREKPEGALEFPGLVLDQYNSDFKITEGDKGLIALLTGQRADESLVRLGSVLNKLNKPFISKSGSDNCRIIKPLYDWNESDIFKYMHDKSIEYCPIYDQELFNGSNLRVSTPLHAETSKRIYQLKTQDPQFYNQIISVFPEMETQARYYKDFANGRKDIMELYPRGWNGVIKYIDDNLEGKTRALALNRVQTAIKLRANKIEQYPQSLGGYPIRYVFQMVINGAYKRQILPKNKASKLDLEYENIV
jgi:predicted phosphoadenosine phosphosulfate sulfurtransferase